MEIHSSPSLRGRGRDETCMSYQWTHPTHTDSLNTLTGIVQMLHFIADHAVNILENVRCNVSKEPSHNGQIQ